MNKRILAALVAFCVSGTSCCNSTPPVLAGRGRLFFKLSASECVPYGQVESLGFSIESLVPKDMLLEEDGFGHGYYRLSDNQYAQFEYIGYNMEDFREPRCLMAVTVFDFNAGLEFFWYRESRAWTKGPLSLSKEYLNARVEGMAIPRRRLLAPKRVRE